MNAGHPEDPDYLIITGVTLITEIFRLVASGLVQALKMLFYCGHEIWFDNGKS